MVNRSPTAAKMFESRYETKSLGIYDSYIPMNEIKKSLEFYDLIIVMEKRHLSKLKTKYPNVCKNKANRIYVLDIPDIYMNGEVKLKNVLEKKINKILSSLK